MCGGPIKPPYPVSSLPPSSHSMRLTRHAPTRSTTTWTWLSFLVTIPPGAPPYVTLIVPDATPVCPGPPGRRCRPPLTPMLNGMSKLSLTTFLGAHFHGRAMDTNDEFIYNEFFELSSSYNNDERLWGDDDDLTAMEKERGHGLNFKGSTPGRTMVKQKKAKGHVDLYNNYFAAKSTFHEGFFRCRFRTRKHVFLP